MCGGFAGFPCPDGLECVDDPSDDCDPERGGADCGGICVEPKPQADVLRRVRRLRVPRDGLACIDDPSDDCDPQRGGADCGGICVEQTEPRPPFCGGFAGAPVPRAGSPASTIRATTATRQIGGADCGGICVAR